LTGLNRRTIMGGDAPSYRGPHQIREYYEAANRVLKRKVRGVTKIQPCPYPEDSQRHFLTLWAAACREGEGIMLDPAQWKITGDSLGYKKMPILKKREKVRDANGEIIYKKITSKVIQQDGSIQDEVIYRPLTKRKLEYREHVISRDMPCIEEFIQVLDHLTEQGYKYILHKYAPFDRHPIKDRPCSTTIVQDRINELHPELFPHAVRALHIRYMRVTHGSKFDAAFLKDYLKWSSTEMANYYLSGQEVADRLGITNPF